MQGARSKRQEARGKRQDVERHAFRNQDGQALVMVLLALTLGVLLVAGFLYYASTSQRATTAALNQTTQRYSSDAGIERGLWWLQYGGLTKTLTTIGSSAVTQTVINNMTVTITITRTTPLP